MKRYEIERAVERARLPIPSVAIMMMLLRRIDARSGEIPPERQPSLSVIASASGCHRSTVMRHLRDLERAGWVTRIRPPLWLAQRYHVPTAYVMHAPAGYPQARRRGNSHHAADGAEARLAAEQALAARDAEASRAASQDHGAERPTNQRSSQRGLSEQHSEVVVRNDDDPQRNLTAIARAELASLTGRDISHKTADEAARQILEGRRLRNPEAYLRKALRADPHRYLPAGSGPPPFSELARLQAEAIAKTQPEGE